MAWKLGLNILNRLTLEFAHGKQIPNVNTANNAPFVTLLRLIDIYKTQNVRHLSSYLFSRDPI